MQSARAARGPARGRGAGTLTLANPGDSVGGVLFVFGGTLRVDGALTNAALNLTVGGGATLQGSGSIAGTVNVGSGGIFAPGDSPGTITVGGLNYNGGSILNYELGQAGVVGGALNDLTIVTGPLTLDGTVNVAESAGGAFTNGLYTLLTYGSITDNGLGVGTVANGLTATVEVNTVAHQVNLIVLGGGGPLFQYWDGTDQSANGVVDAGSGTWNNALFNWTNATGTINTTWQSEYGVFQNPAGTVTLGADIGFQGLIFTGSGYNVNGSGFVLNALGDGVIEVDGSVAAINAPIASGQITKDGSGRLNLGSASTYAGGTTVLAGTVGIGSQTAFGTGTVSFADGTTLTNNVGGLFVGNAIQLSPGLGSVTVDVIAGTDLGLTGPVTAGAGGDLVKEGTGTLFLTNAGNTFDGLLINAGTVNINSNGAAGVGDIVFQGNGSTLQITNSFTIDKTIYLNQFGAPYGTIDTNGNTLTVTGLVYGGGGLIKESTGKLVLTGGNSYSGGTLLNAGTIQVGTSTSLGTGTLTTAANTTLIAGVANNAAITLANAIVLNGPTTVDLFGTFASSVLPSGSFSSDGTTLTLAGTIAGAGSLTTIHTGTLILDGANSYSGGTTLGAFTQTQVGNDLAFGTGQVSFNGIAVGLRNNSGGAITLANAIDFGSGAGDTIGGTDRLTLTGVLAGSGSVTKVGPGTLVLTNTASTLGGTLGIAGGTLQVDGVLTNAGLLVDVGVFGATATLSGTGTIAGNVTIRDTGSLAPGDSPGTLTIGGNLTLSDLTPVLYELGAPNVAGGPYNDLTIVGGTLTLDGKLSVSDPGIVGEPGFGLGVYNLFTYGTLIDNGLDIVSLPGGYTGFIQTLVPGQVNLIVAMPGVLVQYWDGPDMAGNGVVDGGNGTWNDLNTNWTSDPFALNTNWQGGIGVFAATPGTVDITQNQNFVGLQFAVDGYVLDGAGGLTLTAGDFIQTGPGVTATIDTVLGGVGGTLDKQGSGTLVLNAANGYDGGTTISGGTLTVGNDSAAGTGAIAIGNNTTLAAGTTGLALANAITTAGFGYVDSGGGIFTLNGQITGAGAIVKVGSGLLTLNGSNGFASGLYIIDGRVDLGADTAAGSGQIYIYDQTILGAGVSGLVVANGITTLGSGRIDSGPGVFTLNGNIAGPGSTSQIGTGNLVLNGNNSFVNLGINQGTVTVGTNTAAGIGGIALNDGTILAAGVSGLVIANPIVTTGGGRVNSGPGTLTLSGNIGNLGSISQIGTGNLVLNGNNSFAGGLGVNIGTVTLGSNTAAGTGTIALNAATLAAGVGGLTVANAIQSTGGGRIDAGAGVFTLSGQLQNSGGFTKVGAGNLVLAGSSAGFTAPITAAAGRLSVNGAVGSVVTVQSGATLGGTGSVGGIVAQAGSTVAPGNSVGTTTVTGNIVFSAGSTYQVEFAGAAADRLNATGTATLGGAGLVLTATGTPAVFGQTYTILSAAGGRSGSFATPVLSGFGQGFNPTVIYTATDVQVRLNPASIVTLLGGGAGGSQNIVNFAQALDAAVAAGFNPQNFYNLFLQSGAALGASLNQFTGEITAANSRTAMTDQRFVREAALDRLGATLGGVRDGVNDTGGDHALTGWVRGIGAWAKSDADGNGSHLSIDDKGVLAGFDARFGDWQLGALFNYIHSNVDTRGLGTGDVDSTGGAVYGGYRAAHGFAFGIGGSISDVRAKERRSIATAGIAQALRGRADGTSYSAFGDVSFDLAASATARVEPFGRVAYVEYHAGAIGEAGGFAALNVRARHYDTTYASAGLRGSIDLGDAAWLHGSAAYQHTSGDRSPVSLVSLQGTTTTAAIRGVGLDKNAFAGELGVDFRLGKTATLGAAYSGVLGKDTKDNGVKATLTIGW